MANLLQLVTSDAVVAYWETQAQNLAPYLGEELFPSQQKLGLDLKWIKGASGLPVVLVPSAVTTFTISPVLEIAAEAKFPIAQRKNKINTIGKNCLCNLIVNSSWQNTGALKFYFFSANFTPKKLHLFSINQACSPLNHCCYYAGNKHRRQHVAYS